MSQVLISEVGPRRPAEHSRTRATADELRYIDALHATGLREIEVGAFVPPSLWWQPLCQFMP